MLHDNHQGSAAHPAGLHCHDSAASTSRDDGPPDAIYTCPMHPEVRHVGPGICPNCGMALEPVDATAEQDDTEIRDISRRFWISTALTAPLLVSVMQGMLLGHAFQGWLNPAVSQWIEFVLATPVVVWGAWP
ncbi:MAG: copper-transporting ATPase, partial [Phycisphaerales bacterium]|nr:copper-transporting ATPase [Phycisphaerales bacterium]